MNLGSIPEWLGAGAVAAIAGALGYAGKAFRDYWKSRRTSHHEMLARLKELAALLEESRSLFVVQNEQARRLVDMLEGSHPGEVSAADGFEEIFSKLHDRFSPQESRLHGIIRSVTVSPQRRVNEAMTDWLKADTVFKDTEQPTPERVELSGDLRTLELHLNMWHAKYEMWIPEEPKHALVYLADEDQHGVGFPTGIEKTVQRVIEQMQ